VAIILNQAEKVAIWWQITSEIPGKSGKILSRCAPNCGKTGKSQEETSNSSGITKNKNHLILKWLFLFVALPVANLRQFSSKILLP